MEINTSVSLLITIGGIVASVASALAIVKTKVARMEEALSAMDRRIDELKESQANFHTDEAVKIAVIKNNQEAHDKELAEVKKDIKTIMNNVQEIKEAILKVKKGDI